MRKFTLLLVLLLSFVGVANAQEASGSVYDDPTTAPGVTPAVSTVDGTKFAYYLRNYSDKSLFVGPAFSEPTAQDKAGIMVSNTEEASMVVFVRNGNSFDLYSVNSEDVLSSKWRGDRPYLWLNRLTGSTYSTFTFNKVNVESDLVYTINTGGRYLNSNNSQGKFMDGGNASQPTSQWQFIPANDAAKKAAALTINVAAGDDVHGNLATFSASYPVAKPEGYSVYTASYDAGTSTLNMTELEGDVIPGNTGVILKGEVNAALSVQPSLTVPTSVTSALTATNETEKTVADGDNVYGLGANAAGTLALYKLSAGTIGANKAYYAAAAGTPAIALNFGGDVTGISNAQVNNNVNAPMFDLSGRRVVKAVKGGLYIQNGKKFIVK